MQIVRRGRRFGGFTPEGERVVLWAHRILAARYGMRQDLDRMAGGLTGTLRIGAIPTALTAVPLLTTPFAERHGAVRFSLESLSSREIVRRLAEFELDAGMTYIDGEPLGGEVRTVPLYRERHLLLTPADSPLAGSVTAEWADVAELPLCCARHAEPADPHPRLHRRGRHRAAEAGGPTPYRCSTRAS